MPVAVGKIPMSRRTAFYARRTPGRDRYCWHPDSAALAGRPSGARSGPPLAVHQQPQAGQTGTAELRECGALLSARGFQRRGPSRVQPHDLGADAVHAFRRECALAAVPGERSTGRRVGLDCRGQLWHAVGTDRANDRRVALSERLDWRRGVFASRLDRRGPGVQTEGRFLMSRRRRFFCLWICAGGAIVCGCTGKKSAPAVARLAGSATYQGQPVENGGVSFSPRRGQSRLGRMALPEVVSYATRRRFASRRGIVRRSCGLGRRLMARGS